MTVSQPVYRFGPFTLEASEQRLWRDEEEIALRPQTFQTLLFLIRHSGHLLKKEELLEALWPGVSVTENTLTHSIQEVRQALGDAASEPSYIQTVRGVGYRFLVEVRTEDAPNPAGGWRRRLGRLPNRLLWAFLGLASMMVAVILIGSLSPPGTVEAPSSPSQAPRPLSRVTFSDRLEMQPSWSPDGSLLAYASNEAGNFDIWLRPADGSGTAVQFTEDPAQDWQPDWSPDGGSLVFRSERSSGGLFTAAVLGGHPRLVADFGHNARWSPDGRQILFYGSARNGGLATKLFRASVDKNSVNEVRPDFTANLDGPYAAAWHPDGRISIFGRLKDSTYGFWTLETGSLETTRSATSPLVRAKLREFGVVLTDFRWSPAGDGLYFHGLAGGVSDIYFVAVDPRSLEWLAGPERLTTSGEVGLEFALSRDGKVAFSSQHSRIWLWNVDLAADGEASGRNLLDRSEIEGYFSDQARRGSRLFFVPPGRRSGLTLRIWEDLNRAPTFLRVAREVCLFPVLSPSGERIACGRADDLGGDEPPYSRSRLSLLSTDGYQERPLTSSVTDRREFPQGWSPEGGAVLAVTQRFSDHAQAVWFPLAAAPRAEEVAVAAVSHPDFDVDQIRVSPGGRHLAFGVVTRDEQRRSRLFVRALDGGEWIAVAGDLPWVGKPEWAPEGDVLYFLARSADHGEIRGVRLDPVSGEPATASHLIARLDSPALRLASDPDLLLISADRGSLTVAVTVKIGDIWCLGGPENQPSARRPANPGSFSPQ